MYLVNGRRTDYDPYTDLDGLVTTEDRWNAYARRRGGRWTAGPYYFQTTRRWRRANRRFMISLKEFLARQSQAVPETIASQFKE